MSERNYEGDPLDGGWSSYFDPEKHGETVAGSNGEVDGSERVDLWPSALPKAEFTEPQRICIKTCVLHPELSPRDIRDLDGFKYSHSLVRKSLKKAALFATDQDIPRISLPELNTEETRVRELIEAASDQHLLPKYKDEKTDEVGWPEGVATPREELPEDAQRVILKAASDESFDSGAELGRSVEYEKDHGPTYANQVLSEHWPQRYEQVKARRTPKSGKNKLSEEQVSEARKRLLAGEQLKEISADYPVYHETLSDYVRGRKEVDPGHPPALKWDRSKQQYRTEDGEAPKNKNEESEGENSDSAHSENIDSPKIGEPQTETPEWVLDVVVVIWALSRLFEKMERGRNRGGEQ